MRLHHPGEISMTIRTGSVLLLMSAFFATSLSAQFSGTQSRFLHLTFGTGTSSGGDYVDRDGYQAEVLLGGQFRSSRFSALGGVAFGATFPGSRDLTCRISANGQCAAVMPQFAYVATLAGGESRGRYGDFALMGGPAVLTGSDATRIGAQLRADLVTAAYHRTAFVLSPRLLVVPNIEGATPVLRSLGFGLRFR